MVISSGELFCPVGRMDFRARFEGGLVNLSSHLTTHNPLPESARREPSSIGTSTNFPQHLICEGLLDPTSGDNLLHKSPVTPGAHFQLNVDWAGFPIGAMHYTPGNLQVVQTNLPITDRLIRPMYDLPRLPLFGSTDFDCFGRLTGQARQKLSAANSNQLFLQGIVASAFNEGSGLLLDFPELTEGRQQIDPAQSKLFIGACEQRFPSVLRWGPQELAEAVSLKLVAPEPGRSPVWLELTQQLIKGVSHLVVNTLHLEAPPLV